MRINPPKARHDYIIGMLMTMGAHYNISVLGCGVYYEAVTPTSYEGLWIFVIADKTGKRETFPINYLSVGDPKELGNQIMDLCIDKEFTPCTLVNCTLYMS